VWRKWTAATRVKKPKSRTAGVSATEHGRAKAIIDQLQARVNELEEELTSARNTEPEESKSAEKLHSLERENISLNSELEEHKASPAAKKNPWKGKSVREIADELVEVLNRDKFESLSRWLVQVIEREAHVAFYRERKAKAEAEQPRPVDHERDSDDAEDEDEE